MLKVELEEKLGFEVNEEVYEGINKLYMNSDLDKDEFIKQNKKFIKPYKKEKEVKLVFVARSKTPNGCWYIGSYKRFVDFSITTGKVIVENITEEDKTKLVNDCIDLHYQYSYDYWDTQVVVRA